MRVDKLIEKLSEFPPYMDVQFKVFDDDNDGLYYTRYTVDDVRRAQEGSEHFVILEG